MRMTIRMIIQEIVNQLLKQGLEAVHPVRIILFGSAARRPMGPAATWISWCDGAGGCVLGPCDYRRVAGVITPRGNALANAPRNSAFRFRMPA